VRLGANLARVKSIEKKRLSRRIWHSPERASILLGDEWQHKRNLTAETIGIMNGSDSPPVAVAWFGQRPA
jgi:hypothetical protein